MKNTRKKGFTIVELVIVIAVIAILAAVLIPTFSNVIQSANESKALQEARNTWIAYCADHAQEFSSKYGYVKVTINSTDYYCAITAGQNASSVTNAVPTKPTVAGYTVGEAKACIESGYEKIYFYELTASGD